MRIRKNDDKKKKKNGNVVVKRSLRERMTSFLFMAGFQLSMKCGWPLDWK